MTTDIKTKIDGLRKTAAHQRALAKQEQEDIKNLSRSIDMLEESADHMEQEANRLAAIEEQLWGVFHGKRPPPTPEECRDWTIKFGIPEE